VTLVAFSEDWYLTLLPASLTLRHFEEALGHVLTLPSISNSLRYAGWATLLNLVLGVGIAYLVVRTRIRGRQWLDTVAMLPLAVPGLVLAFGYLAMTREGQPFHWLVNFPPFLEKGNPALLLVIAYSVRRLPYIVRSAVAGFQQTSASLEEAAANLGAGPVKTLVRITLPLIAANLIAGAILAFAFSMLEVSDSLILAQKQIYFPITTAIYSLFGSLGSGPFLAAALGVWAMAFLSVSIVGAGYVMGKKLGALFRV
jgi:iron(III) transport system permease protein